MTLPQYPLTQPGADHFHVTYRLSHSDAADARARAKAIAYEQTVEFPADLTPANITTQIVGNIVSLQETGPQIHHVTIAYPIDNAGQGDLPQLLNTIFGNSSIQPYVRVERLTLPDSLTAAYQGPRFGRAGLRDLLNVPERPLLCTALKPMGYPPEALAHLAKQFALGGIDLIKDDHGLADQPYAPFAARLQACADAVNEANAKTGGRSLYVPNITGPHQQIIQRAYAAKTAGAGGVMLAPGLTGFDVMRCLANDPDFRLPILSHPAFIGSFTATPDSGISHYALYGQITRLAGADAVIFPNWGGRFAFSQGECQSIVAGTQDPLGALKSIFPAPGGGMTMDRVPEMRQVYGRDVIFLIGGGLHRHSADLIENSRHFRAMIE